MRWNYQRQSNPGIAVFAFLSTMFLANWDNPPFPWEGVRGVIDTSSAMMMDGGSFPPSLHAKVLLTTE